MSFPPNFDLYSNNHIRKILYQIPGKVENSNFLTEICPKLDLGWEFQKNNLRIKISMLKI